MSKGKVTSKDKQLDCTNDYTERTFEGYAKKDRLQRALSNPEWEQQLFALVDELGFDPIAELQTMRKFYNDFFGFDCPDLSHLIVPASPPGFQWVLPIIALDDNAPLQAAFRGLKRHFKCAGRERLDEVLISNVRDPRASPYVIRFRSCLENYEKELEQFSVNYNDLQPYQTPKITLYERMILEGWYYANTGTHLDEPSFRRCEGSRARGDIDRRTITPGVNLRLDTDGFVVLTSFYSSGDLGMLYGHMVVS